jgi:hypothetical protein
MSSIIPIFAINAKCVKTLILLNIMSKYTHNLKFTIIIDESNTSSYTQEDFAKITNEINTLLCDPNISTQNDISANCNKWIKIDLNPFMNYLMGELFCNITDDNKTIMYNIIENTNKQIETKYDNNFKILYSVTKLIYNNL